MLMVIHILSFGKSLLISLVHLLIRLFDFLMSSFLCILEINSIISVASPNWLPFCRVSSLDCFTCYEEAFNFLRLYLPVLAFFPEWLGSLDIAHDTYALECSPYSFSVWFRVSVLTLKSLVHLELFFVQW